MHGVLKNLTVILYAMRFVLKQLVVQRDALPFCTSSSFKIIYINDNYNYYIIVVVCHYTMIKQLQTITESIKE